MSSPAPDPPDPLTALRLLLGSWRGTGSAKFPTIPTFEYTEVLRFELDAERPLIHYEQRATQRRLDEPNWTASHWESGFLRPVEPDVIEITNAQDSGRLEILRMKLTLQPQGLVLEGASLGLFNDPRMVTSARRFELSGDRLDYVVRMSTTKIAELTPHLRATLTRVPNTPGQAMKRA